MSFVLETKKNGKDIILYNNHKFRESYPVKSGDLVWRCLGKICKAFVRTNQEKTVIFSSNETHIGPHPATARSVTPTLPSPSTPRQTSMDKSYPTSLPPCSAPSTLNKFPLDRSSPVPRTDEIPDTSPLTSRAQHLLELQAENKALKEELVKLRRDRQAVLDHSIESDLRLLQFTENIFTPPVATTVNAEASSACSNIGKENNFSNGYVVERDELETAHEKIKELQKQISELSVPCEICNILKEESKNMIESLRSLEAENAELKNRVTKHHPTISPALLPIHQPVLQLHNRFEELSNAESQSTHDDNGFVVVNKKKNKNRKIKKYNNGKNKAGQRNHIQDNTVNKVSIPFDSVSLIGDSHIRHLASLVKEQVRRGPTISGFCKPGAGLRDMKPSYTNTQEHCFVIMAGTNDVDSGREDFIFRHFEDVLQTCEKSSRVLTLTLPIRHDISPSSPLHHTTRLVNNYMAEICRRHDNVDLLDISNIARRHFTSHGLHLRASGKRFLARLIAEKLSLMKPMGRPRMEPEPVTATTPRPAISTISPGCGTYAAAVLQADQHQTTRILPSHSNMTSNKTSNFYQRTDVKSKNPYGNNVCFLGPPLYSSGIN